MTENDIQQFLNRAADGQAIRVNLASGRVFDGIYNAEDTTIADALYFETMEGQSLRAEWAKIEAIEYRPARAVLSGRFVVPPEHPLAPKTDDKNHGPFGKPYTARNR